MYPVDLSKMKYAKNYYNKTDVCGNVTNVQKIAQNNHFIKNANKYFLIKMQM